MGIFDSLLGYGGGAPAAPEAPGAPDPYQRPSGGIMDSLMSPMGQMGLQLLANNGTLRSQQGAFQGVPEAAARANLYSEQQEAKAEKNKTKAFLRQKYPDIADMVDGGLDAGDAFTLAMRRDQFEREQARLSRGPGPTDDMREYEFGQKNPGFADYMSRNSTNGRLSTQPIYGTDAEGNTVLGQLSNDGRFVPSNLPEGVQPLSPYATNEQKARGTAAGKSQADAQAGLGTARQTAAQVSQQISDLKTDKALGQVLGGFDSRTPIFRESSARVQAKIDQLQGGAFLQARQLLKGGGQITDYEGRKAEAAMVRMNQSQSEADFNIALDDFNDAVQSGVQKLELQAGGGGQSAPSSPGTSGASNGVSWRIK